jgi:hypothetical protein
MVLLQQQQLWWPKYEGLTLIIESAEGGFRPPIPCPPMAVGPDRTKRWHPLGAPDAFLPHAGGLLGPKRIFTIMSGPSANLNSVAEILLARPPKKNVLVPHRSRADPAHSHTRAAHGAAYGCRAYLHGPREATGGERRALLGYAPERFSGVFALHVALEFREQFLLLTQCLQHAS